MNNNNPNTLHPIRKLNNKYVCNYHFIIPYRHFYMISKKLEPNEILCMCSELWICQLYCNINLN